MTVIIENNVKKTIIAEQRTRYLAHSENLMVVVIDIDDGPLDQPDPPHSHPHEQISYVADGELFFFLEDESIKLNAGDIIVIPPNIPHTIQPLSNHVRLVDSFSPIRDDFLEK
jgi:quercetin dioxygenase-like cupin family protein